MAVQVGGCGDVVAGCGKYEQTYCWVAFMTENKIQNKELGIDSE